jgi:hypothetical protein
MLEGLELSRVAALRAAPGDDMSEAGSHEAGRGPGQWMVGLEAERALRDLGMRGDTIKTKHRAFTEAVRTAASPIA